MTLRPLTLIGIILSLVTGVALGVLFYVETRPATKSPAADTINAALAEVAAKYVEEISEEELVELAIDGMMSGLDDHSDYLDPIAYESLETQTTGRFGGIGIELGEIDGQFIVVAPMDDTPAARAGIKAGDQIIKINDDEITGRKMRYIVERLRGEPGSSVALTVLRETDELGEEFDGEDDQNEVFEEIDFDLTRAAIRIASVRSRMLSPGIGYVRISQFQVNTGPDVAAHIEELEDEAGSDLRGLVIDLRNNPGGTLQSSVEVADHFLDKGTIVSTAGRLPSAAAQYAATRGDILEDRPIVVLIIGGSASASEIVAASLKDHEPATLLGTRSFGKGSVQSVVPLDDAQALKLTTAYYYSPDGHTIHGKGIEPHHTFEGDEEELLDEAVQFINSLNPDELQARLP